MKRNFFLAAAAIIAAASISLSSCSNPADKAINLFKDATEQVKNAKSNDELQAIENDLETKLDKLENDNKDFEPNEKEAAAILSAADEFQAAWEEANDNL